MEKWKKLKSEALKYYDEENKYLICMRDIKIRMHTIQKISELKPSFIDPIRETEFVCLQFRSILELILFSNLALHKKHFLDAFESLKEVWRIRDIIKMVKDKNENFYPVSVLVNEPVKSQDGDFTINVKKNESNDFLTLEDLKLAYNTCNNYLHGKNPFSVDMDYNKVRKLFEVWFSKICCLLDAHIIEMADDNIKFFVVPYLQNRHQDIFVMQLRKEE